MNFILPTWVENQWLEFSDSNDIPTELIDQIRLNIYKFKHPSPKVSIVVPAYNEGQNILKTLYSFSKMKTDIPTELIFVDNNSTDSTGEILKRCQATVIFEPKAGIPNARQAGLKAAKGQIILCADSDSVYPEIWVDTMYSQFESNKVVAVYGFHSFVPNSQIKRVTLAIYEFFCELISDVRKHKRVYLNAMAASFAFTKNCALAVGGFDPNAKRGSDGRLAKALLKFGDIIPVYSDGARVWTDGRSLFRNGTLLQHCISRLKKEFRQLKEYF